MLLLETSILKMYRLTESQATLLALLSTGGISQEDINVLLTRGFIEKEDSQYKVTKVGKDLIPKMTDLSKIEIGKIIASSRNPFSPTFIEELQSIFPSGKKAGTVYFWRGSRNEILTKLDVFFKKYKYLETNEEEVKQAARLYVKSYSDRTYMQLLKYFIEKDGVSTLASYIENMRSSTTDIEHKEDWTSTIL